LPSAAVADHLRGRNMALMRRLKGHEESGVHAAAGGDGREVVLR